MCAVCCFALASIPIPAAKLFHNDGMVVEGHILSETPDDVRIETRFGTFTYPKAELSKIQRDATPTPVPTPADNTPPNYSTFVSRDPVNPFSPPQLPPIFQAAAARMTPPPDVLPTPLASKARQTPDGAAVLGTVERLSGEVVLRRDGRTNPIQRDTALHAGDILGTGAGKVALQLAGKRRLLMAADSEIRLPAKPAQEAVTLLGGIAWVEFPAGNTSTIEAVGPVAMGPDPGSAGRVIARLEVTANKRVRVASLEGSVIVHLAQGSEQNPIRITLASGTQVECDLDKRSFGSPIPLDSTLRFEYRGM